MAPARRRLDLSGLKRTIVFFYHLCYTYIIKGKGQNLKHETTLTKRLGKVGYIFGRFSIPLLFLAGFSIIPWVSILYWVLFLIVASVVLIATGWRQHYYERSTADLEELLGKTIPKDSE